jgi:hypothetical protein
MLKGDLDVCFKQFGLGHLEESQKSSVSRMLMDVACRGYPDFAEITRLALERLQKPGGTDYIPRFSTWRGELLKNVIGWKATKRANVRYHRFASWVRNTIGAGRGAC